jgi:hypothetical protein
MKVRVIGIRKVSMAGPVLYSAVLAPVSAEGFIASFHLAAVEGSFQWWDNNPMIRGVAERVMGELIEVVVVGSMEADEFETESSASEEELGRTAENVHLRYRKSGLLEVWVSLHMLQFCITPVVAYLEPITHSKMVIFS